MMWMNDKMESTMLRKEYCLAIWLMTTTCKHVVYMVLVTLLHMVCVCIYIYDEIERRVVVQQGTSTTQTQWVINETCEWLHQRMHVPCELNFDLILSFVFSSDPSLLFNAYPWRKPRLTRANLTWINKTNRHSIINC